jgi:hypothetical protein
MSLLVSGFALPFFQTASAPFLCRAISALFVGSLGTQLGDLDGFSVLVDGDEREIAGIRMPTLARHELFGLDADADFHGRTTDEVDARLHDDEIAQMYRLSKVDTVDRGGHDRRSGMAKGGDRRRLVHHRHDDAAEHVSEVVRVAGHHELGGFVLALLDGLDGSGHEFVIER